LPSQLNYPGHARETLSDDWHGSKAKKKQGCPKVPPPDAVHMSSKLAGPELGPEHPNSYLQQQTPKMKHGRESVDMAKHLEGVMHGMT